MQTHEFLTALSPSQENSLSKQELEMIYAAASGSYEANDHQEADSLFTKLVTLMPFEVKYWWALASTKQMQKLYDAALHAWAIAALLKQQDPWPHFHAAECLLSQGNRQDALKALKAAEERAQASASQNEEFNSLLSKIGVLQEIYGKHSILDKNKVNI